MIDVIPLKYGPIFKRLFSRPEVFCQFASDVLGIPVHVEHVETEYQYPEPVGFVRSKYDLFGEDIEQRVIIEIQQMKEPDFFQRFLYYHLISMVEQVRSYDAYWFKRTVYTIVVLTSIPQDGSVNFSCAIGDFSLLDEHEQRHAIYPHRLVFLAPRLVNEKTPPALRKWLAFIEDSLDGKMEESNYQDDFFRKMIDDIRRITASPEELAAMKNEAIWEDAQRQLFDKEREEGEAKGRAKGRAEGLTEGEAKGEAKAQAKIIKTMLTAGMSTDQIVALTGMDLNTVEAIQADV